MTPTVAVGTMAASDVPAASRWSKPSSSTSSGTMTVPPPTPKSPESRPAPRPMPMQVRMKRGVIPARGGASLMRSLFDVDGVVDEPLAVRLDQGVVDRGDGVEGGHLVALVVLEARVGLVGAHRDDAIRGGDLGDFELIVVGHILEAGRGLLER